MPKEVAKRGPGQPPLGGPGSGPSDIMQVRMAKGHRRKTERAAAAADLPVASFIRLAVLEKILRTLHDEDEKMIPR